MTWPRFRFHLSIELGDPDPEPTPEREGSADTLTERAEPWPTGFCPPSDPIRRPSED